MNEALPSTPGHWPWATFIVNIAGAFILGWVSTRLQERLPVSAYRRPFLGTGLCGALTTFSTMQVELLQMLDSGRLGLAALYAGVSVVVGFGIVATGVYLYFRIRGHEEHEEHVITDADAGKLVPIGSEDE